MPLRRFGLLLIIGLLMISFAGCNGGLTPAKEKRSADNPNLIYRVDADGELRGPLSNSLASLLITELEERLGIVPHIVEHMPPQELEDLGRELKDTLSSFSQITIIDAHQLLNHYFWPEDETKKISLKQLKEQFAVLEKEWESTMTALDEFTDIPVVKAYIEDVDRAFAAVNKAKSAIIHYNSLVSAHNIFHDLDCIWWKTDPPPYGVTITEEVIRSLELKQGFYVLSTLFIFVFS